MKSRYGTLISAITVFLLFGCDSFGHGDLGSLQTAEQGATASTTCAVQGVWSLESVSADGAPQPLGSGKRHMKIVTASHYAWVSQDSGAMQLKTTADTLAAYRTRAAGGGTYTVKDSTYTERLDYFFDPQQVGREVSAQCRVDGNTWHHTFEWPVTETGKPSRMVRVEELWRRVESQTPSR